MKKQKHFNSKMSPAEYRKNKKEAQGRMALRRKE
jgi:hypothetical protein